jgi:adenosylcobinamide-phosphate synthase
LVGRDPAGLDETEIARAVVESLAENLSDAVVATAVWGLLGGAPGALAHRASNTLDAMVGHRNVRYARFGWSAARLDDVLGWPASRATALLVALATPQRARAIWRTCRRDAAGHPSPNAGVAEAAFAAALDLRLGGTNRYRDAQETRSALGTGAAPTGPDIGRAVALVRRSIRLLEAVLAAFWLLARARASGGEIPTTGLASGDSS